MRLCLYSITPTSIITQAHYIRKCFEHHGHQVLMKNYISAIDIRRRIADAYLWVLVANPTWIVGHVASCILSRDRGAIYATIEGIPYPHIAKSFNLAEGRYVAFLFSLQLQLV